ncbi:sugar-binding domain-containing protein [Antarcticibacterium arcticum]|uniref:sugar-binding domain-containing protein n=1 Tax=Antarcticibacterium arcticum TaxID=2585771 RepID=UPI001F0DB3B6|nr:sugar-binding domain-containing protein [Antarcticibacterium arcticum]
MKNLIILITLLLSSLVVGQRQVQTINSGWEFSLEKNDKKEIVNIPHTWNAEDAFRDGKEYYRGKGTYSKTLFASPAWKDQRIFLKFEGSNQVTTVFVNDQPIGEHRGDIPALFLKFLKPLNLGRKIK